MKAIVTKITGRKAVLLRQDGAFVRAANRGYRVGQQISVPYGRRRAAQPLLAAACLVIVLLSATAFAAITLPFSYVSVDVNPSLQMTLNWFDNVRSVEAMNDDAQEIVDRLLEEGIENQPIADAIQMIYSALEDDTYLSDEADNDVVVAVASYGIKDVQTLAQQLEQVQTVQNSGTALNVKTVQVDSATLAEAKEYGTTAGKLAIVKPLIQDSPEETQEWLRKPVREILDAGGEQTDTEPIQPDGAMPSSEPPTSDGETPPADIPATAPDSSPPGSETAEITAGITQQPETDEQTQQTISDAQPDEAPPETAEEPPNGPMNDAPPPDPMGGEQQPDSAPPEPPAGNENPN